MHSRDVPYRIHTFRGGSLPRINEDSAGHGMRIHTIVNARPNKTAARR